MNVQSAASLLQYFLYVGMYRVFIESFIVVLFRISQSEKNFLMIVEKSTLKVKHIKIFDASNFQVP